MSPSPRLLWIAALGLFVAAAPILFDPLVWVAVVGMWLVLFLALALDFFSLLASRPQVAALVQSSIGVGDEVSVPIRLRLARGLFATLRAEVEGPLDAEDVALRIPEGESEASFKLQGTCRGLGKLEALWVRFEAPLGLLQRVQRFAVDEGDIRVVPSVKRVRELTLAHYGGQPLAGASHVQRRAGEGAEFDAMVAYSRGMSVRHVDWKSSARHQALRVRRFRLEQNQHMILCLDTGRTMGDPIDSVTRLDHAIHGAMAMAQVALRAGDRVGVHAYDHAPHTWLPPQGGIRHAARFNEACAALGVNAVETNHVRGLHRLLGQLKRRSLVVVFSEFADSTTAELMVENLTHLAKKHLIIFVAFDDPVVRAPLEASPDGPQEIAESLVALQLEHDRERTLRRLARSGVDVVQGPPSVATLNLLARYVDIKRKGRIG